MDPLIISDTIQEFNGTRFYNETDGMRDYLIEKGVPAAKVVGDYAGFDTYDSCVRARRIFGVSRAIVVTQTYHLPRALATCRAIGLDAWGVGDETVKTKDIAEILWESVQ